MLNPCQARIVDNAEKFYRYSSKQVYQFTGGPGTGKSFTLMAIANRLGIPLNRIAVMTFTGSASILLRRRGFLNAKTIHSWLFNPIDSYKVDAVGNLIMNTYLNRPETEVAFEPKSIDNVDMIFIDEGYQVPYELKYEIESRGLKIIVCGDKDQLPPVSGRPAYLYEDNIDRLFTVMRQAENSGIVYLSNRILNGLEVHRGFYNDVLVIEEDELNDNMILNSDIIICGRNNTREMINKKVRQDILRISSDLPTYGEKVICRKNNWGIEVEGINLANGLIGTVISNPDVGSFDGDNYKMNFKPDLINGYFNDLVCDYNYLIAPHHLKEQLKNNKYNSGNKFEFAYAITCYVAQGNEFGFGIYYDEYLNKDIQKQLQYTGVTRFKRGCIFVKKKRKYY